MGYDFSKLIMNKAKNKIATWHGKCVVPKTKDPEPSTLPANTLLIEIVDSDNARAWVESNFDSSTHDTRNYEKKSDTQYYVTENNTWSNLFEECTYITEVIDGNADNVTSMTYMFQDCTALTSVTIPNTNSVFSMYCMFDGCSSLTSVTLLNTANVTDMGNMFYGCTSLTSVTMPNTSNVKDMRGMFWDCAALTSVPELDTSNVTVTSYMFSCCTSLSSITLPNTGKVTDMTNMFSDCTSLTSILELNTSNVTNMESMFQLCTSLTSIPELDTSKVENMYWMFADCTSLSSIRELNISNVTNMGYMFRNCTKIQSGMLELYQTASTKPVTVTFYENCFTNCGTEGGTTALAERAQIPESWGGDYIESSSIETYEMTGLDLTDESPSSMSPKIVMLWDECTDETFNENGHYELTIDGYIYNVDASDNSYTYTGGSWGSTVTVTVKAVNENGKKSKGQTESIRIEYIDCTECEGTGKVEEPCSDCEGNGYILTDCETCSGSGEVTVSCPDCEGGQVACDICGGTGYISSSGGDEEECSNCSGSGTVECGKCSGSGEVSETCQDCNGGTVEESCPTCEGSGNVKTKCEACDGTGHYHN